MISAATLLFFGAVSFVETPVPGVRVDGVDPLSGRPHTNFRLADIDDNGEMDLLLPDGVLLQQDGKYHDSGSYAYPNVDGRIAIDFDGDTLYIRSSGGLETFRLGNEGWESLSTQEIQWPRDSQRQLDRSENSDAAGYLPFGGFLFDLDGMAPPEIVVVASEGVHVYRRIDGAFRLWGVLDVIPAKVLGAVPGVKIWPAIQRRLYFPEQHMFARIFLERDRVTVIRRRELEDENIRFRTERYALEKDETLNVTLLSTQETNAMPNFFRPRRLNDDDTIDYAGGDWRYTDATPFQVPVFHTQATVDNGQTFHRIRTQSFRPRCSFVDFDGDGDIDMVTESTGLFDGGIRETVTRFFSHRSINHEVQVYLQDALGHFSRTPDIRHRFTVELDDVPYRSENLLQRYQAGELIDVTGDFDADGYRDIAVHATPNRLNIYLNRRNRFVRKPDASVAMKSHWRFGIADVDGDGRSDIVVRWRDSDNPNDPEQNRVYIAQD